MALPAAPYVALYVRIYGAHLPEYMTQSREIGFTLYDWGWTAYVILVDSRGWFMDDEGLLHRAPWIALACARLLPALFRGRAAALLAALLLAHGPLYLSYVDLLPTGFWRFNNIHYWQWAVPGYGILAWLLLIDLIHPLTRTRRWVASVSLIVTGIALCMHVEPRRSDALLPSYR